MQRTQVGLDTLLILIRKAKTKVGRYESLRVAGDNPAADRMIPDLFELRNDITAAYKGALHAADPAERPSDQVMEEVQFLLRALAPGIRRPASETNLEGTRMARRTKVRRSLRGGTQQAAAPRSKKESPGNTETVKLKDR